MQTGLWPGKKMDGKRASGLATWLPNLGVGVANRPLAWQPQPRTRGRVRRLGGQAGLGPGKPSLARGRWHSFECNETRVVGEDLRAKHGGRDSWCLWSVGADCA